MEIRARIADRRFLPQTLSRDLEAYPEGIILPVDKPYRWTSADVIRKLKKPTIIRKDAIRLDAPKAPRAHRKAVEPKATPKAE